MLSSTRHMQTTRDGFTLVELLVVIGIMSVLISLLMPALSAARQAANSVKCAANLRSIGQAIAIYTQANRDSLPYGYWDGTPPGDSTYDVTRGTDWINLLANTMDSNETALSSGFRGSALRQVFRCPAAPEAAPADGSIVSTYSSHPRLMPNLDHLDKLRNGMFGVTSYYLKPYHINRIKDSSTIVLFFEGACTPNGQSNTTGGSLGRWSANQDCYGLDGSSIFNTYVGSTGNQGSWLTDNYALGSGASNFTPTSPISLWLSDNTLINTDSYLNFGNVRYPHFKDKAMNALCVDGHVEQFGWDVKSTTALTRQNVNVNLD